MSMLDSVLKIRQNVSPKSYLPKIHMISQPRRPIMASSLLWEHQTTYTDLDFCLLCQVIAQACFQNHLDDYGTEIHMQTAWNLKQVQEWVVSSFCCCKQIIHTTLIWQNQLKLWKNGRNLQLYLYSHLDKVY